MSGDADPEVLRGLVDRDFPEKVASGVDAEHLDGDLDDAVGGGGQAGGFSVDVRDVDGGRHGRVGITDGATRGRFAVCAQLHRDVPCHLRRHDMVGSAWSAWLHNRRDDLENEMALHRKPFIAAPSDVRISRQGDNAIIFYADEKVGRVSFGLGADIMAGMTDDDILELWNATLEEQDELARDFDYVAKEVPMGKPQVRFSEQMARWVTRGGVVRALVLGDGAHGDPVVEIDDREFSGAAFLQILSCYAGWGVRIEMVPDTELYERPALVVREPEREWDE